VNSCCVVSINRFPTDTAAELALVEELASAGGAEKVVVNEGYARGGLGAVDLADAVVAACDRPSQFAFLTPTGATLTEQIEAIAVKLYGADGVDYLSQALKDLERVQQLGMGSAPVCMAKTQLSLSHDALLRNRPTGFRVPIRSLVPNAGAGFVVALCGDMQRMPGFGRTPAFMNIDIDREGNTVGLF